MKCAACGYRLNADPSPCILCRAGWGMYRVSGGGVPTSEGCHDTCAALREWHERQGKKEREGA
jgi:hypothetical protein